jgi:hypothetical protein
MLAIGYRWTGTSSHAPMPTCDGCPFPPGPGSLGASQPHLPVVIPTVVGYPLLCPPQGDIRGLHSSFHRRPLGASLGIQYCFPGNAGQPPGHAGLGLQGHRSISLSLTSSWGAGSAPGVGLSIHCAFPWVPSFPMALPRVQSLWTGYLPHCPEDGLSGGP